MPKHIPSEHYLTKPYDLVPAAIIHPEIEHRPTDTGHYMLPAVFNVKKEEKFTVKYPGPGVFYIIEGEVHYEDTAKPGTTALGPGAVLHVEEGSVLHWHTPSAAKGFAVFHVPVSVKSFDEFIVPG